MAHRKHPLSREEILTSEQGAPTPSGDCFIALGYPADYSVAASSLGFQTIFREMNTLPTIRCERFFYQQGPPGPPTTVESARPIANAAAIAFSVSCETDLLPVASMLRQSGLAPLAANRREDDPPVIIGGPLTLLDPRLVSPLADVVVCGEAEDAVAPLAAALSEGGPKPEQISRLNSTAAGIWIPASTPTPPPLHFVPKDRLPARAATWSPLADFKDLFLIEIARGCPRRCAFCLLAGTGRFRAVPKDRILSFIPERAKGVGLVGAAVTDHPDLEEIVAKIVASEKRVSLSSMRADRLSPALLRYLVKGGLRTLTVAADGSSSRIREEIKKGITEQHLFSAVEMAKAEKLKGMKLYSMVGLPGETDADVEEFARLVLELAKQIRLTVAIQSFVPKPNTPLGDAPMTDQKVLKARLNRFSRLIKGRVAVQSTSPRWSWIDWKLAHGKEKSALAAIQALDNGGDFAAWKQALVTTLP
ncbi:MAG: radical SAM protein [Deltaproteobacteria bacterium]|nr:radical SAM protein [Deltaproteobacteria bacterium]MBN2671819.1 radical SAM protein [Deltaproteobacteria bacterium]